MAVREPGVNKKPDWYSSDIPMLQFERLILLLDGEKKVSLTTYQNDTTWGLYLIEGEEKSKLPTSEINCIFRERNIEELPIGIVSHVSIENDVNDDISEVILNINNQSISFKAGEIYEEPDNSLSVIYNDESVLVQVNGTMQIKIV